MSVFFMFLDLRANWLLATVCICFGSVSFLLHLLLLSALTHCLFAYVLLKSPWSSISSHSLILINAVFYYMTISWRYRRCVSSYFFLRFLNSHMELLLNVIPAKQTNHSIKTVQFFRPACAHQVSAAQDSIWIRNCQHNVLALEGDGVIREVLTPIALTSGELMRSRHMSDSPLS